MAITWEASKLQVFIPLKVVSESNIHEHWTKRAKRAKRQRRNVCMIMRPYVLCREQITSGFLTITLTRIAPRNLDSDNIRGAFKAVRDGVADVLGMKNDESSFLNWEYAQEKGGVKEYGIRIEIEKLEAQKCQKKKI